tara:strand:+ start:2392 stop:2607 length:216 start_codon:yes stop_codon:yes gene_type:complete
MKKQSDFREEIEVRVRKLLESLRENPSFDNRREVCDKIVQMICDSVTAWPKFENNKSDDDFSEKKERWIAP